MPTNLFYSELPAFQKFNQFTDDSFYQALPSDWSVLISDVAGSTKAIEAGRYKDVNLVGAATICAARNTLAEHNFPFVFGGDGATFAFHNAYKESVVEAMTALQRMSESNFNLSLRIGLVSVEEINNAGGIIEVAKYELIKNKHLALFRGGGLTLAEKWIKGSEAYNVSSTNSSEAKLSGLSCRWNPIPNANGTMLSLLIQATEQQDNRIYTLVLDKLNHICDRQLETANPINVPAMHYQNLRECIQQENRLHMRKWTFKHLYRIIEICFCILVFRLKMPAFIFKSKAYVNSIPAHADYRKFDDILRMVIDVTHKQRDEIFTSLESLRNQGLIHYGIHESSEALMTCYVDDVHEGNHVHFIDGADGGYAMAAKQLKKQIHKTV